MILIIGAKASGQIEYARNNYPEKKMLINLHLIIREKLSAGEVIYDYINDIANKYADGIIISDVIGEGIVPVDRFEEEWREKTGRTLIYLAGRSDEVIRTVCGIGQRIK